MPARCRPPTYSSARSVITRPNQKFPTDDIFLFEVRAGRVGFGILLTRVGSEGYQTIHPKYPKFWMYWCDREISTFYFQISLILTFPLEEQQELKECVFQCSIAKISVVLLSECQRQIQTSSFRELFGSDVMRKLGCGSDTLLVSDVSVGWGAAKSFGWQIRSDRFSRPIETSTLRRYFESHFSKLTRPFCI